MKTTTTQLIIKNQNKFTSILTDDAIAFLTALHLQFDESRLQLLEKRIKQQAKFDSGEKPQFPKETASIRNENWTAAPIPEILLDRRVEITGPVDRKMVINALNSETKIFMADFEDSCT